MPYFDTFNTSNLDDQFVFLTRYAYITPERSKHSTYKSITKNLSSFKNSNFVTTSPDGFPNSLDAIFEMYMNQPITDRDKNYYLSRYTLPFMSTGLTLRDLVEINSDAIDETLNKLMMSKKIQHINSILSRLCSDMRMKNLCKDGSELKKAIDEQKAKYKALYNATEEEIAINWITAVEKEPKFLAMQRLFNLSAHGNSGPKRGGKECDKKRLCTLQKKGKIRSKYQTKRKS
jgi:hypothetical protein